MYAQQIRNIQQIYFTQSSGTPLTQIPSKKVYHRCQSFPTPQSEVSEAVADTTPKFRPFIAQDEILKRVTDFRHVVSTSHGNILVKVLPESFIVPASDLLADSFAESMGYYVGYKNFLRKQIRRYLSHHLLLPPKAVILAAILLQNDDPEGRDNEVQPSEGLLVGLCELSFAESTRSKYLTLNPPGDRAYLCNMAIGPEQRRKGYGAALLAAGELLASQLGEKEMYLHLRFKDEDVAGKLYRGAGYEVYKEDLPLIKLLGKDRRYLMKKSLIKM